MEENTSGHGEFSKVPYEIKEKWNWGAFLLTWIWGIRNSVFVSFLVFVPIINLFVPFYLGAKGNELAWKHARWDDLNEFKRVQKRWGFYGVISTVVFLAVFFIGTYIQGERVEQQKKIETNKVTIELKHNEKVKKIIGTQYSIGEINVSEGFHSMEVTTPDGTTFHIMTMFNNENKIEGMNIIDGSGKLEEIITPKVDVEVSN